MRIILTIFSLALFLFSAPAHSEVLIDATGTSVELGLHPQRIVTLAPSVAEIAADLLGTDLDRIVGVSAQTNYPEQLNKKKSIGAFSAFNIEVVLSLKPDLILATFDGNPSDRVLKLRSLGLKVVVVKTQSPLDVSRAIRMIGAALGLTEKAAERATLFESKLAELSSKKKTENKPRALLQIGDAPLVVAGGHSFLGEILVKSGVQNIYQEFRMSYPKPSIEDVLSRDPDLIIVVSMDTRLESAQTMIDSWRKFPRLKAVKTNKVFAISGDTLLRPSFRLLEGLAALNKIVEDLH